MEHNAIGWTPIDRPSRIVAIFSMEAPRKPIVYLNSQL